ncbi:MAG: DMT family transporter [Anaerolineales bacterium]|nr:DMT family transporter [Anaerolineales bacterium]
MQRSALSPTIEVALAITFWALSFVFIKIALREMAPLTLIMLRYAIGIGVLGLTIVLRGEQRRFKRSDFWPMFWLGLVVVVVQQLLQVQGQVTADASVAAFLAACAPAFIVLLAALFLREPVAPWQWLGVLLATFGAMWVAGGGDWQAVLRGRLATPGNGLVLLSAVVWGIYSILSRKLLIGRPAVLLTAGMFAFGWLILLPVFLWQRGWQELPGISPQGWLAVLLVGVLSTALTYLLYGHALQQAPASRLASIQTIEPLIATLAAILILGEKPTMALWLGGLAIMAGIYLAEWQPIRPGIRPQ